MSDEKLIGPPGPSGASSYPAPFNESARVSPFEGDHYPAGDEEGGLELRRYLHALVRYKWLLALSVLLGIGGGAVAWHFGEITYTARGNIWVEAESGRDESSGPIRQPGLLQSNAWIELMRSYTVLDPVVVDQRLAVVGPDAFEDVFDQLTLQSSYRPGSYELHIDESGTRFTLANADGVALQEGTLGEPVGSELGFLWTPESGSFPAGEVVPFRVMTVRDAAQNLRDNIDIGMDRNGNFLSVSLSGTSPTHIAAVLNSVMERHVRVAAELKRSRLDETSKILEQQLLYTEEELAQAERDLEEFRINTITLPTDRSAPITAGLQVTIDPVFDMFFTMTIQLEEIRRDRERLSRAMAQGEQGGGVRIEALEVIPAAAGSSELRRILDELVGVRSQLRVLRDRYADDYPPIQDLLVQANTIETRSIPQVAERILEELEMQERDLRSRLATASSDLEAIPPRTIEVGRLERRVAITENLYNDLRGRVETARLAAASSFPDVRVLDRAAVPQQPTEDSRLRLAALIFLGFVGAATGGAFLLDRMDARFHYASDVSRDIGLDILGSIPRIKSGRGQRGVLNAAQALEAFRELRIHMGFAYGSAGPITISISSPAAAEGKSLIASNLAVAFAEVGRRTLLIDGDTRRGDAHRLLGLQQSPGLVDYLRERSGQEIIQQTEHDNLDFIGCGSRGTSTPELLASPRMAYFMGTLKRSYDVIIVDTPPLAAGGDAMILSALTGNLAVVIRPGATERQLAQVKLEQLSRLPIRTLGAILNDVDPTDGYYYYYTGYLPGYEPVPAEEDEEGVQLISNTETKA